MAVPVTGAEEIVAGLVVKFWRAQWCTDTSFSSSCCDCEGWRGARMDVRPFHCGEDRKA